ncbi:hypothetical protein ACQPZ2_29105 [Nocardia pseudovaccinii]|uniref:hypothetical protein n=1 Tax=Nocardia pseudovaccinii TaxID=189540 RepID=UPI003D8BFED3
MKTTPYRISQGMFGPEGAFGLIVCDWHGEIVLRHRRQHDRSERRAPAPAGLEHRHRHVDGPQESFYRKVFNEILTGLGTVAIRTCPHRTRR